jgi:Phytochelatin synthase
MVINALRGLPSEAAEALVTQAALLEKVGNDVWSQQTAEDGAGVTVAELVKAVQASLQAYGLGDVQIEVLHPDDDSPETLERVRHLLSVNERSSQDVVLAYFNQGVLTGDWDGPHISPIGAYDARRHQVLIFDVDREWYVPYWSGDDKLLAALLRPAPAEHGVLAGQTGTLIRVHRARKP